MTDCKIIDLGTDIGDGRMIAPDANLIFLERPIPILIKDPEDPYSRGLIGSASSFWISNTEMRADITLQAGEDPTAYTYHPEFDDLAWNHLDSNPPLISLVRGRVRALAARRRVTTSEGELT